MRKILIVGASSSIGEAITKEFVSHGDHVIATYKNTSINYGTEKLYLDLMSDISMMSAVSQLHALDSIIFLAGIVIGKNLSGYNYQDMHDVMSINFISQIKLLKHLMYQLNDNSQILMMSSISGQRGSYDPIYAASKAAILGFVKSMTKELAPRTKINAIAPGIIQDTEMYKQMSPETIERHRVNSPSKDFLDINKLAKIVLDLTLPHWSHLNGACIDLNGGLYVR